MWSRMRHLNKIFLWETTRLVPVSVSELMSPLHVTAIHSEGIVWELALKCWFTKKSSRIRSRDAELPLHDNGWRRWWVRDYCSGHLHGFAFPVSHHLSHYIWMAYGVWWGGGRSCDVDKMRMWVVVSARNRSLYYKETHELTICKMYSKLMVNNKFAGQTNADSAN